MCATSMGITLLGLLAFLGLGFFVPVSVETSPATSLLIEPTVIAEPVAIAARWHEIRTIGGDCGDIFAVDWAPDGSRLVGGCNDGTVRIWDATTGALLHTLEGHTTQVWTVDWSPNGEWIASGSEDGTIRIWDTASGASLNVMEPNGKWVSAVEWASAFWWLASSHGDGVIRIWGSGNNGPPAAELRGDEYTVNDVSWFFDSNLRLVSGGGSGYSDNTVRLWDRFEPVATYWGHQGEVWTVAVSPDGTRIASGSSDHTVRVWSVYDGSVMFIFEGHTGVVNSVAWSPTGQYVVSASSDGTLRFWDMATGSAAGVIETGQGWVGCVAWAADGRIASAGADGTIRIWAQ